MCNGQPSYGAHGDLHRKVNDSLHVKAVRGLLLLLIDAVVKSFWMYVITVDEQVCKKSKKRKILIKIILSNNCQKFPFWGLQLTYRDMKLAPVCSDFSPQKRTHISITCSCPLILLYLSFSMLFNFLWFLPCWCVSQLIQNPTESWKGKKWEKRLRKREREAGRMRLISASLLFVADCLRAVEPLCSSCMCECYSEQRG